MYLDTNLKVSQLNSELFESVVCLYKSECFNDKKQSTDFAISRRILQNLTFFNAIDTTNVKYPIILKILHSVYSNNQEEISILKYFVVKINNLFLQALDLVLGPSETVIKYFQFIINAFYFTFLVCQKWISF